MNYRPTFRSLAAKPLASYRLPKAVPPKTDRWGGAFKLLELAGLMIALAALRISNDQTTLAKEAFQDQQISSAWSILAIPGGGFTGKQYALQTLMRLQGELRSIKVECKQSEQEIEQSAKGIAFVCDDAPDLAELNLSQNPVEKKGVLLSTFRGVDMFDVDLSGLWIQQTMFNESDLVDAKFIEANLQLVSFRDATLFDAKFTGSNISRTSFASARLDGADLRIHSLDMEPGYDRLRTINISDAVFCASGFGDCGTKINETILEKGFYYPGHPPIGFDPELLAATPMECSDPLGDDGVYYAVTCKVAQLPKS